METPVSIQVVSRAVMDDQKATTIKDVLENVSGVRAQPSLGDVRLSDPRLPYRKHLPQRPADHAGQLPGRF
jgi:hypothetical protein